MMSAATQGKCYVQNLSKYLQRKSGTKEFRRFENELRYFEIECQDFEEFSQFQMEFWPSKLSRNKQFLFVQAYNWLSMQFKYKNEIVVRCSFLKFQNDQYLCKIARKLSFMA